MPDDVKTEHKSYSVAPLPLPDMGYGSTIHETTITDSSGNKYTGTGYSESEANAAAGKAMNEGRKD